MTGRDAEHRQAFLAAIREDPRDELNHRAFADWLSDNGFDDEAAFHREEWTLAKHDEADAFFADLVAKFADNEWNEGVATTPEFLIDAACRYLDTGNGLIVPMNNLALDTDEYVFWQHFRILTGRAIPASKVRRSENPWGDGPQSLFVCSCGMPSDFDKGG